MDLESVGEEKETCTAIMCCEWNS